MDPDPGGPKISGSGSPILPATLLFFIITSGQSQGVHSVELRYGAELPGALFLRVPVVPRLHRPLRPHPSRARLPLGQVRRGAVAQRFGYCSNPPSEAEPTSKMDNVD
jgi:hypothetical protein